MFTARKIRTRTRLARPLGERRGAVLILALLILAMITVMGIYSATKSSIEQRIANNMRQNMAVFFAAEAGLRHGKKMLADDFQAGNAAKLAAALEQPDWDFALNGTTYAAAAATYFCGPVPYNTGTNACGNGASHIDGAWASSGVQLAQRTIQIGNLDITYTVTMWDNDDEDPYDTVYTDENPQDDSDGLVYLRSVAVGTVGGVEIGRALLQMTLRGEVTNPMSFDDPVAQANFGPGKASAGRDIDEIDVGDLGTSQSL